MPKEIIKDKNKEYFLREKKVIGNSTVDFDGPVLAGGKGVVGKDANGKKFLDFTGQISLLNTGYAPKDVVSAIRQQVNCGVHSCISADFPYCHNIKINGKNLEVSRAALAERLIELSSEVMPFNKRVFFEVSGATGINAAGYIAEITRRYKNGLRTENLQPHFDMDVFDPKWSRIFSSSYLSFRGAFHGRHGLAKLLTNSKPRQLWGVNSSYAVGRLPFPKEGSNKKSYLIEAERIVDKLSDIYPIVAFFFEPIQGEGGINVPDPELLADLISFLRERNIYIIADEVQTGLGRSGKMFACEHFDIQPDMIVLSKSLGAGIPMAAIIVNDDKFISLEPGMHSGSHHATPLATAAAIANIEFIQRKNLCEESLERGKYILMELRSIQKMHTNIPDVRGLGLMIGIEFYSIEERDRVVKECKKNGLLIAPAGEKTIRMTPPLIVTNGEINRALEIFEAALN